MYGSDETSIQSTSVRSQNQETEQCEVPIDDDLLSENSLNKNKTREPLSSITLPVTTTKKSSNTSSLQISADYNQSSSIANNDIEAAFDSTKDYKNLTNKSKDDEIVSTPDSLSGLTTIRENVNADESIHGSTSSKHVNDNEINFDNYFNQINQANEDKMSKTFPSTVQQSKSVSHSKEQRPSALSQSDDIYTPAASVSVKLGTISTSSSTVSIQKRTEDIEDSTDDDVGELLGNMKVSYFWKMHTHIHTHIKNFSFSIHKKFSSIRYNIFSKCMCVSHFPIRKFLYSKKGMGNSI